MSFFVGSLFVMLSYQLFSQLTVTTVATYTCTNGAGGITTDNSGNVYYTERTSCDRIIKLDPLGNQSVYCNLGSGDPVDIEMRPNGEMYVAMYTGNKIVKIAPGGGSYTDYVTGASNPFGLTFDGDTLYFIEYFSQRIYKVLPGGGAVGSPNVIQITSTYAITGSSGHRTTDLALLSDKTFIVTTYYTGGNLYKVTKTGTSSLLLSTSYSNQSNIIKYSSEYLFTSYSNHRVIKYNESSNTTSVFAGNGSAGPADGPALSAQFNSPNGICTDGIDVYVANYNDYRIKKIYNSCIPTVSINSNTITCTSHTVPIVANSSPSTGVTYTWTGPGIASGVNSATAQVFLPGIYSVSVANGTCVTTQTVNVTHDNSIPTLTLSVSNSLDCTGNSTADITASSNTTSLTYTWSGPSIVSGQGTNMITVDASGTYSLVIFPSNPACYNAGTVAVTGSTTAPTPTVTKSNDMTCINNTATLTVLPAGMSYTWTAPVTGTIISGANSATCVVTGSGIYNINVESAPGCIGTGGISVNTNTTPPTVNASASNTISCTNPTIAITATTSPVNTTTVTWSGPGIVSGQNTKTVIVNQPGTYTVVATNTVNGCTSSKTVSVSGNTTPPSFTTNKTNDITCSLTTSTLSVNQSGYSYNWVAPTSGTILTSSTAQSVQITGGGNYSVTVTNTLNGCSSTSVVGVSTFTTAPTVSLTVSSSTACVGTNVTLTGSPSGGIYSGSYVSGNTFNAPTAGTYTVAYSYTNSYGCSATNTKTITVNNCTTNDNCSGAISLSVPSTSVGSVTGATTETGVPTCAYTTTFNVPGVWYSVVGNGSYIQANLTTTSGFAQMYLYQGTCSNLTSLTCKHVYTNTVNLGWCSQVGVTYYILVNNGTTSGNFTINITSPTQPSITVTATPNNTICAGNSATLSASSSYVSSSSYTWNPGSYSGSATYVASPTVTTTYTVTGNTNPGSGIYGCVLSGTYTQSVVPFSGSTVSVTANPNPICYGNQATLTASGANTYTWNTGSTSSVITQYMYSTTNYTVTGTNSSGCKSSAAITVTVNSNPYFTVSKSNDITCTYNQATLTASDASLTYTWIAPGTSTILTGQSTPTITLQGGGTYTVVGTNTAGCSYTVYPSVNTYTTPPTVNLSVSSTTVCETNSVTLSGSPSGGVYTGSFVTGNVFTPTVSGTYTVAYTYTNSYGCVGSDTETITVVPFAGSTVSVTANPNPICYGNQATLTASGANTYTWSTGNTGSVITQYMYSTTNYTVTGTNSNGCKSSAAITVTVNPSASFYVTKSNDVTCTTNQVTLTASNNSLTYTWTAPATSTILTGQGSPTITLQGGGTYTVVGTNTAGCSYTVYPSIYTYTTPPSVILSVSSNTVCTNNVVNLYGSPSGGVYTGSFVSGSVFTPTASGTYTVAYTYTNSYGCVGTDTETISVIPFAGTSVSVAAVPNPICYGNQATLTATGANTYTWNTGSTSSVITQYMYSTTNYTVTGTNSNGCKSSAAITVTVNNLPSVSLTSSSYNMCVNQTATLTGSPSGGVYTGSFVTGNLFTPTVSGTYSVAYSYTNTSTGCTNTAVQYISVGTCTTLPNDNCSGAIALTVPSTTVGTTVGANYESGVPSCPYTSLSQPGVWYSVTGTGGYITADLCGTSWDSKIFLYTGSCGSLTSLTCNDNNGPVCSGSSASIGWCSQPGVTYYILVTGSFSSSNFTLNINQGVLPTVTVTGAPNPVCATNSATLTASGGFSGGYTWNPGNLYGSSVVVSPTITTNYTVTSVSTGAIYGCTLTGNYTQSVVPFTGSTVSVSANPNPICSGNSVTLTASGANTYTWSTGNTGSVVTQYPSYTQTYTVTGTNSSGCKSSASIQVTVNPTPYFTVSGNNITCTYPTATLYASNSSNSYTWVAPPTGTILSGANSSVAVVGASGTYTAYASSGAGCTYSVAYTVNTYTTPPSVSLSLSQNTVCVGNSVYLTGSPNGGVYTGSFVSGSVFTPTTTGTYTVAYTYTNSYGCVGSDTETITVVPFTGGTVSVSASSNPICYGTTASLTASGANTYTWNTGSTNSVITVSATSNMYYTNNYTVTATNSAGCKSTANITMTFNPTTYPSLSSTSYSMCPSSSATLTGSPSGGVYSGSFVTGNVFTPTVAGTYTVAYTYTNSYGCVGTTSTNIQVINNYPVLTTYGSTITCTNPTGQLYVTPSGLTYTWTAPTSATVSSGVNSQYVYATGSGVFTVTVKDPNNGCTSTATVALTTNTTAPTSTIMATGAKTITCTNSTASLSATPNGMNYYWTASSPGYIMSGSSSQNAVVSVSGNGTGVAVYSVTVTNPSNGCSTTVSVSIPYDKSTPTVTAGSSKTLTCGSASVQLVGSVNPSNSTINWTGGVCGSLTSLTTAACNPGIYTLTAVHPNTGCSSSSTVQVFADPTYPYITTSVSGTIGCTNGTAQVIATTTSSPVSYSWTGTGITSGANTATATVNQAGTYTVTVTNTLSGCTNTAAVTVTSNTYQPLTITGGNINCSTSTPTLVAYPSGLSYTWTTSNGNIVSGANSQSVIVNAIGVYSVVAVNPNTGCSNTASISVGINTIAPVVSASVSNSVTCTNNSVTLVGSSNPSNNINVQWLGGVCGNPNSLITYACSGGTYTLVVIDMTNGCSSSATVNVLQDPSVVTVTATAMDVLDCNTNTVNVVASVTGTVHTYSWSGPGIVSGNGTATIVVNQSGNYYVTVTNTITGCPNSDWVYVNQISGLYVSVSGNSVVCQGNAVSLTASGATSYTWSTGSNATSINFVPSTSTVVTVTGQSGNCVGSTVVPIVVNPNPVISVTSNSTDVDINTNIQLNAFGGLSYTWSPASSVSNPYISNPTANMYQTTTFCAEGINTYGCRDTACVQVRVNKCGSVKVPNIFSPNGDNINDEFCVLGISCLNIKEYQMIIYNRWGEKIFETNNWNVCWLGTYDGEVISDNSVVYYIRIVEDNGTETILTGDVTIVK